MSINDMKEYMALCLEGEQSIPRRKEILRFRRKELAAKIKELESSIDYIDSKQRFYDRGMAGEIEYRSNLIQL